MWPSSIDQIEADRSEVTKGEVEKCNKHTETQNTIIGTTFTEALDNGIQGSTFY